MRVILSLFLLAAIVGSPGANADGERETVTPTCFVLDSGIWDEVPWPERVLTNRLYEFEHHHTYTQFGIYLPPPDHKNLLRGSELSHVTSACLAAIPYCQQYILNAEEFLQCLRNVG